MTVARRRPSEEASTRGPEAKLSLDHAKSIQKQRLYREWGVASVRGVARIKIEGLAAVGAPSSIPRPDYGRDAAAKRARGLRPRGPRHRRDLKSASERSAQHRRALFIVAPSSSCSRPFPWLSLRLPLSIPRFLSLTSTILLLLRRGITHTARPRTGA